MPTKAAAQASEMYNEWQKIHDTADEIDGKNKLREQYTAILDEAANYTGYESEKELQAKQKELDKKMAKVLPEVAASFGNNALGKKFTDDFRLAEQEQKIRLSAIFRGKTIDNFKAAADKSYVSNMNSFIATGDDAYKQAYISDMDKGFKAGLLTKEEAQRQKDRVEEWNALYLTSEAERDPDAFIKNIDDYNNRFKNVDAVRVAYRAAERKARFQELETAQNQSNNYAQLSADIRSMPLADAMANIDAAEKGKAISKEMAKELRESIGATDKKVKGSGDATDPKTYLDFTQRILDIQNTTQGGAEGLSLDGKGEVINAVNKVISDLNRANAEERLSDKDLKQMVKDLFKEQNKVNTALKIDDNGKAYIKREYTFFDAWKDLSQRLPGDLEGRDKIWRKYTNTVSASKPEVLDEKTLKGFMDDLIAEQTLRDFTPWLEVGKAFADAVNEEFDRRKKN